MQNIEVHRYAQPKAVGWAGYIEPTDKSWIAFIDLEGRPKFYLNRDETGRVLPADPADRYDAGTTVEEVGATSSNVGAPVALPPLILPDGARLDSEKWPE